MSSVFFINLIAGYMCPNSNDKLVKWPAVVNVHFNSCFLFQISLPPDFKVWYETMCAEFPTRFGRLFRGPMWSGVAQSLQKDPLTISCV